MSDIDYRISSMSGVPSNARQLPSKLGVFYRGLLEACWLAAAVCVPLAMEPDVERIFHPFKCVWISIFGVLAAMAWGLYRLDAPLLKTPNDVVRGQRIHSLLPVVFFFALGLSTVFSLYPAMSLFGSQTYILSGFEVGCLGLLFAAVAVHLDRWEQVERLVSALLAPVCAVALYAVYQRVGLDTAGFSMNPTDRTFSFEGHPLFLSGWLLMILPFIVWRLVAFQENPSHGSLLPRALSLAFHLFLIVATLAAFLSTGSRGPTLALLAGGFFAGILLGIFSGRRWITVSLCLTVAMGLAGLIALAMPGGVGAVLRTNPLIQRLATTLPIAGGGDPFRTTLWNSAPQAFFTPALSAADGQPDRWHALRILFGFGNETSEMISPQHWTFGDSGATPEGTYHNLIWDLLMSGGTVGLLSFIGFFLAIFHRGYLKLGFIPPHFSFWRFLLITMACAVPFAVISAIYFGPGFSAIGLQFGIIIGLVGIPVFSKSTAITRSARIREGLLLTILIALAMHWIEAGFAYHTPVTAGLFWILAGAAFALSSPKFDLVLLEPNIRGAKRIESQAGGMAILYPAALGTLVLVFLFHAFLRKFDSGEFTAMQALWACLVRNPFQGSFSLLLPFIIIPGGLAALLSGWPATLSWKRPAHCLFLALLVTLALSGGYALIKAWNLSQLGAVPKDFVREAVVMAQLHRFEFMVASFYVVVLALVLILGIILAAGSQVVTRKPGWVSLLAWIPVSAAGIWLASFFFVRDAAPELAFSYGLVLASKGDARSALPVLRKCISDNPLVFYRSAKFADILEDIALRSEDNSQSNMLMSEALRLLDNLCRMNALSLFHHVKGELLIRQACRTNDKPERVSLAREALAELEKAVVYWPGFESPWTDKAFVEGELLDDHNAAAKSFATADALGSTGTNNWADQYLNQSVESPSPDLQDFYRKRALYYYDEALRQTPPESPEIYRYRTARGTVLRNGGDSTAALAELLAAIKSAKTSSTWQAMAMAANCYHDLKQDDKAREYIQQALQTAPENMKKPLQECEAEFSRP